MPDLRERHVLHRADPGDWRVAELVARHPFKKKAEELVADI
jgi:hypothetical protein